MTFDKRLPAPKHYPIQRKETKYISRIKGSRSRDTAVPAVVVLREILGYAENEKEAKKIVKDGQILRNGEVLNDIQQGIGILDVVEIPETEEAFRVIRDGDDLKFVETEDTRKVGKIVDKSANGDEFVYRLHNGENFQTDYEYSTGNTLIFEDDSVTEEEELEEGSEVLVIDGNHAGETAEAHELREGGMEPDTAMIESDYEFETRTENLVAINGVEVE